MSGPDRRAGAPVSGAAPGARLGAIVVNRDAGDALTACVASLRAGGIRDVVVVDNASSDGSLARLAAHDARALLEPTGTNLGYGTAANRGARRLSTEYLLVCNPDLRCDPGAPAALVAALDAEPTVALVGPRIVTPSGEPYPSARAFPSMGVAAGHALVGLLWPGNRWSRRYRREEAGSAPGLGARRAGELERADWVSGACMAVRASAFDSVGGFDEGYFMYVEDLDLCWRLHRAGWEVGFLPAARVVHEQGRSTRRRPYRMLLAHHRSAWRFARKRASGAGRLALPVVALGLLARLVVALGRQGAADRAKRSRPRPAVS